jgi:hypothetical protein
MSRPQIFAFPVVLEKDGKRVGPTDTNTAGAKVIHPEFFYMSIPGEVFEVPAELVGRIQAEMAEHPDRLEDRTRRAIKPKQGKTPAVYHQKWEWTTDPLRTPKMIAEQADEEAETNGNAYQGAFQG